MMTPAASWLAQVRHDLVKRLLWPARDRHALGGPVQPGELVPTLVDDEGAVVAAPALWTTLRAGAPAAWPPAILDAFAAAVTAADAAARADDVAGVLQLEVAFAALTSACQSPTPGLAISKERIR
ncbi:MAG TPA: hypothetical protein VH374_07650 [Polyangia bacterium]|jgi:hypothetical protein|nr:hypothetical protein [Polyangia bacterium]